MKVSELKQIIESVISEEVKRTIMEDNEMGKMEKYHIKCEGLPLATFESQEEAEEALPDYKEKHPGKELIIEKGVYESHDDMMNKLDEINDQLEETDNMENTEKQPMEGNQESPYEGMEEVVEELKEKSQRLFEKGKIDDEELYEIENIIDNNIEEYWDGSMDGVDVKKMFIQIVKDVAPHLVKKKKKEKNHMENTQPMEGNEFSGALKAAKDAGEKTFSVDGKEYDVEECWSKEMKEEEECDECGGGSMEESKVKKTYYHVLEDGGYGDIGYQGVYDTEEEAKSRVHSLSDMFPDSSFYFEASNSEKEPYSVTSSKYNPDDDIDEGEAEVCEKCGKELCECGGEMNESKKKKILRLTETELTELIAKMVTESVPGLNEYNKAHTESGKENKANLSDVDQKIKKAVSVEGNDNPEFPKQIGKGKKVARQNTKEQDEEVAKNFAGLENLEYDIEPSEQFKKRLKMAIEGDKLMGNSSKDVANVVSSDVTVKKMEKQIKDREKDKEERVLYKKEAVPTMNESKVSFKNVLNEELEKIKKIFTYDKKTQ